MPGETSVNKIPYPIDADAPDGPTQIKALAELLDTLKWGSRNLKPTVGVKAASSPLVLGESFADISGAKWEVTPNVASVAVIVAVWQAQITVGGSATVQGTVRLDATDQTRVASTELLASESITQGPTLAMMTQIYVLALTAEAHTVKLRAKKLAGSAASQVGTDSAFLYALLAS